MKQRALNDEQVMDLLLIGLNWLATQHPDSLTGWTGNGILRTMERVGAIGELQRKQLAAGRVTQSLRDLLTSKVFRYYGPNDLRKNGPQGLTEASKDKLFIARVTGTGGIYYADRILVPGGYNLLSTKKGRAYAQSVAPDFEPVLTFDTFRGTWDTHVRQTRGMQGAVRYSNDDNTPRSPRRAS